MRIFFSTILVASNFKFSLPQLILAVVLLCSCVEQRVAKFEGETMGTTWHVSIAKNITADESATLKIAIANVLDSVNSSMSTFRQDSEITNINNAKSNIVIPISNDLRHVLTAALMIGSQSKGAYDITVEPLVDIWGFGKGVIANAPQQQQIEELLTYVGQQYLHLSDDGLMKDHDKTRLDLSSIAKGYAVDRVLLKINELGYHDVLVEIGGEVAVSGNKYAQHWQVGVEQPKLEHKLAQVIALKAPYRALASSGNYRNFIDYDGLRATHTLNPQTGYPLQSSLLATTVFATNCMLADGYATALMALGERAAAFAKQHNIAALLIFSDGDAGFRIVQTASFTAAFGEQ